MHFFDYNRTLCNMDNISMIMDLDDMGGRWGYGDLKVLVIHIT